MVEITRHFTASVYIVYDNKVLLHNHKKLNLLLPSGGHLDRDELPHEGIIRECKEECGIDIQIMNFNTLSKFENSFEINIGEFCNVHFINPFHQHIDFIFFATCVDNTVIPGEKESKKWYWFSKEEIEEHPQITSEVKKYALAALNKLED